MVYSFLGLLGSDLFNIGGFLTSLPTEKSPTVHIDFAKDFNHLSRYSDAFSVLKRRTMHTTAALWDIIICWFFVFASDTQFKRILSKIVEVSDKRQPDLKYRRSWSISSFFLLAYWLCLLSLLHSFSSRFTAPASIYFLIVVAQICYTCSEIMFHCSE